MSSEVFKLKQGRREFVSQIMACCIYPLLSYKNLQIMNAEGVTIRQSEFTVKVTIDRLQAFLVSQGATVYARIDQQAELKNVGQNLLPLEFILFGNPKGGGPLMIENPLVALDLPLKIIAWEDNEKKVWIAYNEASYIEERYSLKQNVNSPLALDRLVEKAISN